MGSNGQIITANGVQLCIETFGTPGAPAVLLVHGASASMLWWEGELCRRIAAGGRYVIRFDNRDTGRSVSYPPGRPGYTLRDLTEDAIGILDVLGVERAHVVGRSMAGAIAAQAAVLHADRVATLTIVSSTPGTAGLPPMSDEFLAHVGGSGPDPADGPAVVEFIVGLMRAYSGGSPHFDEAGVRALAVLDVQRTVSVAACLTNHFVIDFGEPLDLGAVAVPTLVVHGDRDPVFPLEHGTALRAAIPGAELLVLARTGHELPPPVWAEFVPRLLGHTA